MFAQVLKKEKELMRAFFYPMLLLIFTFCLALPCLAADGGVPLDDIKKAATEGLNDLLKGRQFDKHFQDLGFESQSDIDDAELGEGFQIFTIHPDQLLDETAPHDLQSLVVPIGEWQFIIFAKGKAKSILTIRFFNGKWTIVGIGPSGLAIEIAKFMAVWPSSSDYQFRFIKVYQAQSSFIELFKKGKAVGIVPLTSLSTLMTGKVPEEFNPSDIRDSKEALSLLRPLVKQNIELYKKQKSLSK